MIKDRSLFFNFSEYRVLGTLSILENLLSLLEANYLGVMLLKTDLFSKGHFQSVYI